MKMTGLLVNYKHKNIISQKSKIHKNVISIPHHTNISPVCPHSPFLHSPHWFCTPHHNQYYSFIKST